MKYTNQLINLIVAMNMIVLAAIVLTACKKDKIETPAITSLTVGNFKISGKTVKLGSNTTTIANNNTNGTQMALIAGENNLYFWPVGDSLKPYYVHNKFASADREVYSIFLCGDTLTQDAVIIKENIPYRTDSTAGIRFINLSPNSTPLNITLSTTPTVNEVSNLAFKDKTNFISYPAPDNIVYTFQVRAANNPNIVLTSFSFSRNTVPRYANVTLVIRGLVGASPALGVTRVNNDR